MRGLLAVLGLFALASATLGTSTHAQDELDHPYLEGWYDERELLYYDFGSNTTLADDDTVVVKPVWVFIHGMDDVGEPERVDGQHNVIDVQPGEGDYSDLWEVNFVTVPEEYEANTIRSAEDIRSSGFETELTDKVVNCPVVPEGTTTQGGEELIEGWEDGDEVYYYDFGPSGNSIAPVWFFQHEDGSPVEEQYAIFDSVPEDDGYTAFRRVHIVTVQNDYEANTIQSGAALYASGLDIEVTDEVLNLPITRIASEPGEEPNVAVGGSYATNGDSSTSRKLLAVVAGVIVTGALMIGGAFAYRRRSQL